MPRVIGINLQDVLLNPSESRPNRQSARPLLETQNGREWLCQMYSIELELFTGVILEIIGQKFAIRPNMSSGMLTFCCAVRYGLVPITLQVYTYRNCYRSKLSRFFFVCLPHRSIVMGADIVVSGNHNPALQYLGMWLWFYLVDKHSQHSQVMEH